MPRKEARAPNIGHIDCPCCERVAPIRKNTGGKLYIMCGWCGHLRLTMAAGQDWILVNGHIWGPEGCPADVPGWIRLNLAAPPKASEKPQAPAAPEPEPQQESTEAPTATEPEPQAAPVQETEAPTAPEPSKDKGTGVVMPWKW